MLHRLLFTFLFLVSCLAARAQYMRPGKMGKGVYPPGVEVLLKRLPKLKSDTARANTFGKIILAYGSVVADSLKGKDNLKQAKLWSARQMELANKQHWKEGVAGAMYDLAIVYDFAKDYQEALNTLARAPEMPVGNKIKAEITKLTAYLYTEMAWAVGETDKTRSQKYYQNALDVLQKAIDTAPGKATKYQLQVLVAGVYTDLEQYDKAKELLSGILPGLEALGDKKLLRDAYSKISLAGLLAGGNFNKIDMPYSLKILATFSSGDTTSEHVQALQRVSQNYRALDDMPHALEKLQEIQQLKRAKAIDRFRINQDMGYMYAQMGDYTKAYDQFSKALAAVRSGAVHRPEQFVLINLANAAYQLKEYDRAVQIYQEALQVKKNSLPVAVYQAYLGLAEALFAQKKYAGAINSIKKAQEQTTLTELNGINIMPAILGVVYLDAPDSALVNAGFSLTDRYQKAAEIFEKIFADTKEYNGMEIYGYLSRVYEKLQDHKRALNAYQRYTTMRDSVTTLQDKNEVIRREIAFNFGRHEDSLKYQQLIASNLLRNQLNLSNKEKDIAALNAQKTQANLQANQQKLKATEKEQALAAVEMQLQKTEIKSRRSQGYYLMGGIAVLVLLSVFIGRNYYNQRRSNKLISAANAEITAQRDKLNEAIGELKATQQQLIQSEKMASLGELTAGIAHEIQNPLNFVNNFSEVSVELLEELKEEVEAGNKDDVLAIAGDLTTNLQKINHHGKRADFIVKGMLQHSRTSSGERQLTNINVLADEFLKLSYHGLRAKDKNFNAEIITNFDETLPKVNIVQQDIGRVLLNLFNNAFYAVNEKKKTAGADYKPEVTVTTFAPPSGGWAASVRDNGIGIPDAIKDKIMQPFFTTKPTGAGTGLGLSLSYDIVVKGHGGTINIESKEGEGSDFIVKLPL